MSSSSATDTAAAAVGTTTDPYIWLEDVESEDSLNFARESNEKCLNQLGNPEKTETGSYERILKVLESDDRIPSASCYGHDEDGEPILFNFWKDSKNPKGILRKTSMTSYQTENPEWVTVLNVDELAEKDGISWVYKGSSVLPRARDPTDGKKVTRALLNLSRGGSDAVHVKEFDFVKGDFVGTDEHGFVLPEAKSRVSYKSRDVLLVGTDFGLDSLTDSGYPRTVREWVRGTPLEDAPVVFEGEKQDVSVSAYISDERTWNGGIYEIRSRALTFYTSKQWIRIIQPEHLLAPNDPKRAGVPEPEDFCLLDVQDDADVSTHANLLIISLRSDWQPVPDGPVYKQGSVLYTPIEPFLKGGAANAEYKLLFEPTDRTSYSYFTATKNYMMVFTMDNVKEKIEFYRMEQDGLTLTPVGPTPEPQIKASSIRPFDSYSGSDLFWYSSSDYLTPSTLSLADASKIEGEKENQEAFLVKDLKSLPPQYDSSGLVTEQRTAISKDGTEVPYFIVMKKDIELNGKNPTLLYGYGGFEISLGPKYIATTGLAWLERGGVYVEANIRGGGEFGPFWHKSALKANRNKSYEDFIAVGEHLVSSNICSPKTLAARGGSNGGLLMGNMYTMRPDLWGAIHCAVPLLDMQRFHKLLAGASWMAEYGNPDTDDWKFLEQYSPYHNLKEGVEYPPILVTTSTRDDRVHPGHARKFVKKLWDMGVDNVHYYENIEGGHGGAADAKQSAYMLALALDFLFDVLSKNAAAL